MWNEIRTKFQKCSSYPINFRRVACKKSALGRVRKCFSKGTFYLALWICWVIIGTLYYAFVNGLGIAVGFYQAVNIGYSIGYGYPREPDEQNWWFSSAYVILGASLVGVALGFFADKIVEDSNDWFTKMLEKQKYENDVAPNQPFLTQAKAFIKYNKEPLRAIFLWGLWVLIMIMYSMIQIKWPFSQAQYFAVSTCSTGGHMPIPDDSPNWLFGVTGFFAAIGVPLMGVAMASLGSLVMEKHDDLSEMKEIIEADVTPEELLELQRFGLEDGDGEVDKAEYIILCMVRLGTDPRLVQFISKEFQKMDTDHSNSLSILEITKGKCSYDDLREIERCESYKQKIMKCAEGLKCTAGLPKENGDKASGVSLHSIPEEQHAHDEENQTGTAETEAKVKSELPKNELTHETGTAETDCVLQPDDDRDAFEESTDSDDGIFF